MKYTLNRIALLVAGMASSALILSACSTTGDEGPRGRALFVQETAAPEQTGGRNDTLQACLSAALEDDYHARATYAAVIEAYGPVLPFAQVIEAEERHVRALLGLFEHYGLEPPPDRWAGRVPAPASLEDARRAAVEAEIANAELYDRLLVSVDREARVREVFLRLQAASRERHLPAFQRSLERDGRGRGRGERGEGCRGSRRRCGSQPSRVEDTQGPEVRGECDRPRATGETES